MKKISLVMLMHLAMFSFTLGQAAGSKSLMYVQTARTFAPGQFQIRVDMNFFTKLSETSVNYYLANSSLALTYGVSENFDITVAPGIYQDTHKGQGSNIPDDLKLFLKGGSFAFADRQLYLAALLGFKFPLGENHNYPLVDYASSAIEYGFNGAFSYYTDPYLPEKSFSTHLNIGWWNHNEAGEVIFQDISSTVNSSKLIYGIGMLYPTDVFDFQLEVTGISYVEPPDEWVLSREDWLYVTPAIKYKGLNWLHFNFGIDIRLSADEDNTNPNVPRVTTIGLPNYVAWKAHFGFDINFAGLTSGTQSAGQVEREQFNKRVEFFQQIIEDREQSENIKQELDQLKEERESAEEELEELKQILEEEG